MTYYNNEFTTNPHYSFEFFPTKSNQDERDFWRTVGNLEVFNPDFFSVTYGALGSARQKSIDLVTDLHQATNTPIAAHLTVADASKAETDSIIQGLWDNGIRHIVAITGDNRGDDSLHGYRDSLELVEAIKRIGDFDISVAAYPEVHPLAKSADADIDCLKAKFAAGATRAITQYFFEASTYLRFRDRLIKAGVNQPVVPGILPIHDFFQVRNFSKRCGTSIPDNYSLHFAGMEGNHLSQHQLALDFALELCENLITEGVEHLHFYTLNRSFLTLDIIKHLSAPQQLKNQYRNVA